ncbi:MAG: isocitrate lyase [Azospirillaceae bacterium]
MAPLDTASPAPTDSGPRLRDRAWRERRFAGIRRDYTAQDVARLSGSIRIDHTLARLGAERLWELLHRRDFVNALGATNGNQAMQMVRAGLEAIYLSGWQVAADANTSGNMYPDQSLYPANSVPEVVRKINRTLERADQIEHAEGGAGRYWFAPIVADAEAGFGGPLNSFELMKAMIEAGAAGVHFEDQLASEKKCGHLGGKVLVPMKTFVRTLNAARLAADVMDVPTVLVARTDAESAKLITADIDERDLPFIDRENRTEEGFYPIRKDGRLDYCIARGLAFAPYADLLWMETSTPDLGQAKLFAEAIRKAHPDKMLAYNCSPSFNWKAKLDDATIAKFQRELGAMGFKFQFITLAGFHSLNYATFELARGYQERQMAAYAELQAAEFAAEKDGYTATKHQREVGTGYFDQVSLAISGGTASTIAMADSTETAQFH